MPPGPAGWAPRGGQVPQISPSHRPGICRTSPSGGPAPPPAGWAPREAVAAGHARAWPGLVGGIGPERTPGPAGPGRRISGGEPMAGNQQNREGSNRQNGPGQMTASDRIPQVLVVDDEPNIRELVQVALKFHGCAVSTAGHRGRCAAAGGVIPAGPDRPGRGPAGPRRLRGVPAAAGRRQRGAGDLPDRPGHLVRHRDRAGARRGRLRHQAVLGGGAGRQGPCRAAPGLAVQPRAEPRKATPSCASATWNSTSHGGACTGPACRWTCRPPSSGCSPT